MHVKTKREGQSNACRPMFNMHRSERYIVKKKTKEKKNVIVRIIDEIKWKSHWTCYFIPIDNGEEEEELFWWERWDLGVILLTAFLRWWMLTWCKKMYVNKLPKSIKRWTMLLVGLNDEMGREINREISVFGMTRKTSTIVNRDRHRRPWLGFQSREENSASFNTR